jgi:hypothetical protein
LNLEAGGCLIDAGFDVPIPDSLRSHERKTTIFRSQNSGCYVTCILVLVAFRSGFCVEVFAYSHRSHVRGIQPLLQLAFNLLALCACSFPQHNQPSRGIDGQFAFLWQSELLSADEVRDLRLRSRALAVADKKAA